MHWHQGLVGENPTEKLPDLRRLQSPQTSECTPENGVCMAGYTGMVTSSCIGELEGRTPLCCKVHEDELVGHACLFVEISRLL